MPGAAAAGGVARHQCLVPVEQVIKTVSALTMTLVPHTKQNPRNCKALVRECGNVVSASSSTACTLARAATQPVVAAQRLGSTRTDEEHSLHS